MAIKSLLGLQGVQWVWRLVVVRVSWSGHPRLPKKNGNKEPSINLLLNDLLAIYVITINLFLRSPFLFLQKIIQ